MKKNCWEFKNCGRQPGGANVKEFGVCPSAAFRAYDGKNCGQNGGRYCWKIAGTFCGGTVQGSYALKRKTCSTCEFYLKVEQEEGESFNQ